jgi:hypothetical protein
MPDSITQISMTSSVLTYVLDEQDTAKFPPLTIHYTADQATLRFKGNIQADSFVSNNGSPLVVTPDGNAGNPVTNLDIQSSPRTGAHLGSVKGLYVTGNFGADRDGIEFRHSNGSEGIGFGYNTIYATGSNTNQDLNLKPKGTGNVGIGTTTPKSTLSVAGGVAIGSKYAISNAALDGQLIVQNTVGIGTTIPSEKLEIKIDGGDDQKSTFLSLWNGGSGATQESCIVWKNGDDLRLSAAISSCPGDLRFQTAKDGVVSGRMILDHEGNLALSGIIGSSISEEVITNDISELKSTVVNLQWSSSLYMFPVRLVPSYLEAPEFINKANVTIKLRNVPPEKRSQEELSKWVVRCLPPSPEPPVIFTWNLLNKNDRIEDDSYEFNFTSSIYPDASRSTGLSIDGQIMIVILMRVSL